MKILAAYKDRPTFADVPARDLTERQALDLLMHLVYKGEIVLNETIRVDKSGRVTSPRPGQQISVGTEIAGVAYYRATSVGFPGNYMQPYFQPTPSFAIVLYRLARFLGGGYWRATRIVWGGIGSGADGKVLNCHGIGTCVDFYGAVTALGTFDVLEDWANQPIYLRDGSARPGKVDNVWGTDTITNYRLRYEHRAYSFFAAVYQFAHEQTTVSNTDPAYPAFIFRQNLTAGNIIHPDYPTDVGLRGSHQEHMHFQLGAAYIKTG